MSDKYFLDTNILIYAHTDLDLRKQQLAQQSIMSELTCLSTQVLQETANILFKKFQFTWPDIQIVLKEAITNNETHINSAFTVTEACRIAGRYGFSFYDSLIIAAALESACSILLSEDMHHGIVIDDKLRIKNPFLD